MGRLPVPQKKAVQLLSLIHILSTICKASLNSPYPPDMYTSRPLANNNASSNAVSYTHLDVYKRQIRIHANGSDNSSISGALTICTTRNSPYKMCIRDRLWTVPTSSTT